MKDMTSEERSQPNENLSANNQSDKLARMDALAASARRRRRLTYQFVAACFFVAIPAIFALSPILGPPFSYLPRSVVPVSAAASVLGYVAMFVWMGRFFHVDHKRIQKARADLGLRSERPENKYEWLWRGETDPSLELLERKDRGQVPDEVLRHLYTILRATTQMGVLGTGKEVVFTTLSAVAKVGDERAISYVVKIANWKVKTPDMVRIRDAAKQCLDELKRLAEEDRVHSHLLRPAANEPAAETTLLRPARQADELETTSLLRPAHQADEMETTSLLRTIE